MLTVPSGFQIRKAYQLLWLSGFATILLLGWQSGLAEAHVLRQANGVEAELHIPPDDLPQAKQPTRLEFSFDSTGQKFNLQHCSCMVMATGNGRTTASVRLQPSPSDSTVDAIAYIDFPAAGNYSVLLTGHSTDASFQDFRLSYPARVIRPDAAGSATSGVIIIAGTGLLVLGAVGYSQLRQRRKRRPEN